LSSPIPSPARRRRRVFAGMVSALLAFSLAPAVAASPASAADTDDIKILRAEWFTSGGAKWLSVEAQTTQPASNTLTVTWDGGSANMNNYTDAGVYLYHRFNTPVPLPGEVPDSVTVTSSLGGSATAEVDEWLEGGFQLPEGYKTRFITGEQPPDPTQMNARLEQLAAEFPQLAEIITMPELTHGYRRYAQAQFGTGATATANKTFFVTSEAWGHEGGNQLTMELVNPGTASSALAVTRNGNDITVSLGTNAEGALVSTAAEVVAAINASSASEVLKAYTYRRNAGGGVVDAAARTSLSDFLSAPDSVSRDPFQMKVLRVGKVRDGSKTGVFLYAGEHPNEITPVYATIEAAERLLRNYATDEWTRKAVDNLDIFILPWTNPDGGHHSIYDAGIRKNMNDYCAPEDSDPGRRNSRGVNLNRNFGVASLWDGYSGASFDCYSGNSTGPAEESEPETRNQIWLANRYTNIKFAMNTHCCGGYFMWTPGAYIADGRVSVERPNAGIEQYYYENSEHILDAVQQWRDTAVWPGRNGPIIDVLYSAAGNSADYFWVEHGWLSWAFETNGPRWHPELNDGAGGWRNGSNTADVHETAMEYANGLLAIVDVALEFELDDEAPESRLVVTDRTATTTSFTFETSEAATIYYTLDGSEPTLESTELQTAGLREGAETITVDAGTVVNWIAVDPRGNVENDHVVGGDLPTYESWALVAGGTAYDDIDATLSWYLLNDRITERTYDQLVDRNVRAKAMAATGSESRTIGLLQQLIAKANNQIKGDAADVVARNTLVEAVQSLIEELQAADDAENAAA
jgi:hypothetical protein